MTIGQEDYLVESGMSLAFDGDTTISGEFLEDGTPDQIFDNPQHPRLKEFLDKVLNV